MKNRNLPLKIAAVCFLFSMGTVHGQDFKTIIQSHMAAKSDFQKAGLKTFEIINEDYSQSMNVTVTDKSSAAINNTVFANAASSLGLKNAKQYQLIGINEADLEAGNSVKNRLIYFLTEDNNLRLCYEFIFEEKGTSNYWDILADASTGEILSKQNLTLSCNFKHDAYKHDYSAHTPAGFAENFNNEDTITSTLVGPMAAEDASYRVFALPLESPSHGGRTLVNNPWFTDASPDGWHTALGTGQYAGIFTSTQGNNVRAYDDKLNKNVPWNYGKGGSQNDYVQAESQDGGGTNNANFSTPTDGARPRMQMYLWDPGVVQRFFYNTPPEATNRLVEALVSSTFGPELDPIGVTANVVLSPILDGCTPLPENFLVGKIGLIQRGDCNFTEKVKNAQVAGATAAIIYSMPDSTVTAGMGGEDITVTIPSVLIPYDEGVYLKGLLAALTPVNVTLKYDQNAQPTRDGSFDNGIIIHEYGHGISNRNTGNGSSCLNSTLSKEQMGEGWSDIFALMLTNRPGDNASVPRGIGTYATSAAITGGGIRPAQYSPDFAINPFKYANTNGMEYTNASNQVVTDVHSIGFVWSTMLWDLHWKYVEKYGYSSDVSANKTNGSTRVLQVVMDGLKLQGCQPGFIEGRNAILAAELASETAGADKCMIWNVFAKRGLGVNASAGSKTNINDQVGDDTVPAECLLATNEADASKAMSIYPNPAKNEFFIKSAKNILGKVSVEIYDASGKLVSSQKISSSEAVNTQSLQNGVYIVKVAGLGVNYSSKLMIKK